MTPKERAAMQPSQQAVAAMRLALEALENAPIEYDFHGNPMDVEFGQQLYKAITALREALAEQAEQEPVAVYGFCPICGREGVSRGRGFNGNDTCVTGHRYASSEAIPDFPQPVKQEPVLTEFTAEQQARYAAAFDEAFAKAGMPQKKQTERVTEGNGSEVSLETEAQEPMAWNDLTENDMKEIARATLGRCNREVYEAVVAYFKGKNHRYAAPQPVQQVDLTDVEVENVWRKHGGYMTMPIDFARAAIAADREKNK